jgi:ABC-type Mn2+/Zn2+ transport system permease subunit/Mn-dependent DtxR family transcriptional regulator
MTILMGALVAVACAWIGCYLILQGMALIGDAISHTVLLGIVLAFLITGQVSGPAIFVAAAITGVGTTLLIDGVHRASRLKEDAATGIVFTSLFALGVVLLSTFASRAHIDTQHVLYGNLEFVTSGESVSLVGRPVPVALCQMAGIAALLLVLIVLFYKELLIAAFDPQLAASLGLRPALVRYGMLAILSLTLVGAFSSVGAILVVGMLIAPAATAYLLTSRLSAMFVLSAAAGALSAIVGYHVGYWLSVSAAGAIVCTACGFFIVALLFSPRQGLVAAAVRRLRRRLRTSQENIIRQLLKSSADRQATAVPAAEIAASLAVSRPLFAWSVRSLDRRGWIDIVHDGVRRLRLTPSGLAQAQRLDRAHRLWETYLVDQIGLPSDHVHPDAEVLEHALTEPFIERLDDALGHPDVDPHGAPIPRSSVSDVAPGVFTLSKLRVGDRGRLAGMAQSGAVISQAERPPADVLATLGLPLGGEIRVADRDLAAGSWTIEVEGSRRVTLPHDAADALLVQVE